MIIETMRLARVIQRWSTFLHNHAQAIVVCDFCIAVTASFRMLYKLVVMEHATKQILHCDVTAHPTVEWTLQQLREAFPSEHEYRFLIHDRDSIFSKALNESIRNLRLHVLSWRSNLQGTTPSVLCESYDLSPLTECAPQDRAAPKEEARVELRYTKPPSRFFSQCRHILFLSGRH